MIGETVLGRGDRAFDYYTRIAPAWQDHVTLRKVEPYVYAQMVAGKEAQRPGEAKNSWLTVDGVAIENNVIAALEAGLEYAIDVVMG